MSKSRKNLLLNYCFEFVQKKQDNLLEAISDSKSSLGSESQSTAGDKHDTSRAMMHLEIEKKGHQLGELEKLKKVLTQVNTEVLSERIGLGSIIETDSGFFFIAINAGKTMIDTIEFTIVSLASPFAQILSKTDLNGTALVMNRPYKIKSIC